MTGQIGSQWKTLVVSTGNDTQDIGYGDFYEESANNVSFSITWKEIAKVKVIKEVKAIYENEEQDSTRTGQSKKIC